MRTIGSLIETARAGGRVPDRHHNPYVNEALELEGTLFTPEQLKSFNPKSQFADKKDFFVEVGTYMGKNLIEMAEAFPESAFMGLDITYKRTVKTARKIQRNEVPNASIGLCDARPFFADIAQGSTSGVCVFFPDPWPKKRHAKNRLVRKPFFDSVAKATTETGFLWLKTDSLSYFEEAQEDAKLTEWVATEEPTPSEFKGMDFKTVFEALFERKGLPSYSCVFRKRGH